MAAVVWLKRDLRLADHGPLAAAAASGQPTIVLYCYEPSMVQAADFSCCHLQVRTGVTPWGELRPRGTMHLHLERMRPLPASTFVHLVPAVHQ